MRTEDLESALLNRLDGEIGFGCFHVLILALSSTIALCVTFGTISISLVMPVNESDLELSSSRKGGIEACLFMGMLVGSVLFGWLSDAFGRRIALLWALPLTGASLLFSAFSFHWAFFLVMVFSIGVGTGGSIAPLLTYVAECSAERLRGPLLIVVQSCQDLSIACATFLAWALMGSNGDVSQMSVQLGSLRFVAWRLYLVLCASFVLLVVAPILCAPESPLFLLHRKQDKKLQKLLERMQRLNSCGRTKCHSGGKASTVKKSLSNIELLRDGSQTSYDRRTSDSPQSSGGSQIFDGCCTSDGPQTSDSPRSDNGLISMALREQECDKESQELKQCGHEGVESQTEINQAQNDGGSRHEDKDAQRKKQEQADSQEVPGAQDGVVMEHFSSHSCGRVMLNLICKLTKLVSTFYCSSHAYKTIILHVLFFTTLFGYYGAKLWYPEIFKRIPLYKDAHPFQIMPHAAYRNQSELRDPYAYYQDALFITLSPILSNVIAVVMFKALGAKILLVASGLITSAAGISMWFVSMEHGAILALCCVYNASISLALSSLKIGATNLYPTAIRSTALGLHSAVGRLGAIAANIVFGELVDTSVALPMLLSAGMVLLGTGVGLFIPRMYNKRDEPMLYKCASKVVRKAG